jgi:hypothetical protein
MAHCANKIHFVENGTLDRVETAIVLGVIGSGLAACAIGAIVFDFGRMISIW